MAGSRNAGFERTAQSSPEINYTLQGNQIRKILTSLGFIVISGYALESLAWDALTTMIMGGMSENSLSNSCEKSTLYFLADRGDVKLSVDRASVFSILIKLWPGRAIDWKRSRSGTVSAPEILAAPL